MSLLEKATIITTPTAQSEGKLHSIKGGSVADFDVVRGSAATRVNAEGLIEDIRVIGDEEISNGSFSEEGVEEVTNGDFSNGSTDWTLGTGWSIGEDKAISDGTSGNLYQSGIIVTGKQYKIQVTVSDYVSGNVQVSAGAVPRGTMSANGTYTFYQTASSTSNLFLISNIFNGSITNISVKEVGQNWTFNNGATLTDLGAKITHTPIAGIIEQSNILLVGKQYKLTYEITESIAGSLKLVFATDDSMNTGVGVHTKYFESTGSNLSIARTDGISNDVTITNISVVEVIDATNIPRIDYSTGEGILLLEPQSTNLVTYSEDFSDATFTYWQRTRLSLGSTSVLSPSGNLDASKITEDTSNSDHYLRSLTSNLTTGQKYVYSIFVKANGRSAVQLKLNGQVSSEVIFDLSNGSINLQNSGVESASINEFEDNWFRISASWTYSVGFPELDLINSSFSATYLGDGASGVFVYGAQLEEQPYATSYIPTSGAIATRLADTITGAGSTDLINSTEGVLYAEIAALADNGTNRVISLNSGQRSNSVRLYFDSSGLGEVTMQVRSGNVLQVIEKYVLSNLLDFNKVAIKYKENDFALWVNGIEVDTDTSGITPIGLDTLSFNDGSLDDFHGKTKTIAVFSEALTDEELTCLTTI